MWAVPFSEHQFGSIDFERLHPQSLGHDRGEKIDAKKTKMMCKKIIFFSSTLTKVTIRRFTSILVAMGGGKLQIRVLWI
jgi:hypothetical protein